MLYVYSTYILAMLMFVEIKPSKCRNLIIDEMEIKFSICSLDLEICFKLETRLGP